MINAMADKNNKMTIEDLAGMLERNFPTKEDLKKELNLFESRISGEIQEVRRDLWETKTELEEVHDIVKRIDEKDLPNLKRRVTNIETIIKPLRK